MSGFVHVGDHVDAALGVKTEDISKKMGVVRTVFDLGLNILGMRAADIGMSQLEIVNSIARAEEQLAKGSPLCESPIERMVLAALLTARWAPRLLTVPPIVHDPRKDEALPKGDIVIVPQLAFVRFRFDFGVVVERDGRRSIFAVECDGEEFHQHARRLKERDDYLASWDVRAFHLTGAQIYRDPHGSVGQVAAEIAGA